MADWSLIAALLGTTAGAGFVMLMVALRGRDPDVAQQRRRWGSWSKGVVGLGAQNQAPNARRRRITAVAAVGLGVLVWVISGWPVFALAVAGAVATAPVIVRAARRDKRKIEKYEALEDWIRRIAGGITSGTGLTTALVSSYEQAQPPIYREVRALSARLSARMDPQAAIREFADDINDPLGDLVAAALVQILTLQASGSTFVLSSLADTLSEEVIAARKIETERASPRLTVRIVVLVAIAMGVAMGVFTNYLAPYGSAEGQVALGVILLLGVACMSWMWTKTTPLPDQRFMRDVKQSRWSS